MPDAADMKKIGFVGLGNMGLPIALNVLAKAGTPLMAIDKRPEAVAAIVSQGATAATDLRAVGQQCDVVILSLPTPTVVYSVLFGQDGLEPSLRPGTLVIDLSTNSPDVARAAGERLNRAGVQYLESPVTGGIARAKDGTLTVMVGGNASAFRDAQVLYDAIATQAVHVGDVGAASTMKLINNMMFLCNLAAAAEGAAMAAKAGVDLQRFSDIVHSGSGFSAGFRLISSKAFYGDFSPAFALDLAYKDFMLATELGDVLGVPSIMGSPALSLLRAARNRGYGTEDSTAVLKVLEGFTGVEARLPSNAN